MRKRLLLVLLLFPFLVDAQKLITDSEGLSKAKVWVEQGEYEKIWRWNQVDMLLKNTSINKEQIVATGDITQGAFNYYTSYNPEGIFNVKTYSKISIKEVCSGINWGIIHCKRRRIKT